MDIDKPISLRPRFRESTSLDKTTLLDRISVMKSNYKDKYRLTQSGNHLWIHHLKKNEKIYTPHLHLELVDDDYDEPDKLIIKGLYSPNSAYWTMFMFLHFILACLFIGFMIMAYTKSVVNESFWPYIYLMISVGMIWIGLYFFARYNRLRGLKQAKELEKVYEDWIRL
jgi:hypothetical protein